MRIRTTSDGKGNKSGETSESLCINLQCSNHGICDLWTECSFYKGQRQPAKKSVEADGKTKYKAEKVTIAGITFDSRKEATRYFELRLMEQSGKIKNLERQKSYELIPSQCDEDGMVVERAVVYIADFVYEENGKLVVEDVKGYRNPSSQAYAKFVLKRKLMLYKYGIRIKET